jgi:beta-glucanase (GH16 family)
MSAAQAGCPPPFQRRGVRATCPRVSDSTTDLGPRCAHAVCRLKKSPREGADPPSLAVVIWRDWRCLRQTPPPSVSQTYTPHRGLHIPSTRRGRGKERTSIKRIPIFPGLLVIGAAAIMLAAIVAASTRSTGSTTMRVASAHADPDARSAARVTTRAVSGGRGGATLLFDDEFNGSSLSSVRWSKGWLASGVTPPVSSLEYDCYAPDQVAVTGGALELTAVAKAQTCAAKVEPFSSGMVNTDKSFRFRYGYAVARIWLPAGAGLWPAWWTDGQNWPADGEIDVMEAYDPSRAVAYHYRWAGCGANCAAGGQVAFRGSTSGWHTYAVDWRPGVITWYYDAHRVWSFSGPAVTSSPQYLVLNLATNAPTAAVPAVMRVDYVRVYTSKP